jgi:hypothetical protein
MSMASGKGKNVPTAENPDFSAAGNYIVVLNAIAMGGRRKPHQNLAADGPIAVSVDSV